ncbi:unnamed protein product [Durusdinium trenchii]|uniref:RING-type domain-containing protein n=1 Tax=Durusdinium trenchii TaxID=1381693 RepID=A0ABP0KAR0_9DINO
MAQRSVPLKAAGVIADGARGEVWRAVALQAHLLGKPPRPVRTRSSSAGARQESQVHSGLSQPSRSAPSASGFRHAELDYDEKIRRHQASLSLAQRMGLVAEPAQPLTSMQWEVVKHRSDTREDSEVPCSICLEDFRMRPQVILSCSHVFHGECLRSFERFAGKRQCPLCRCPYFDATIHHSGLMVWRKKCASRIQRAWRGYLSRKELFNELRLPSVRKEAPTLHRRFCGKALQAADSASWLASDRIGVRSWAESWRKPVRTMKMLLINSLRSWMEVWPRALLLSVTGCVALSNYMEAFSLRLMVHRQKSFPLSKAFWRDLRFVPEHFDVL